MASTSSLPPRRPTRRSTSAGVVAREGRGLPQVALAVVESKCGPSGRGSGHRYEQVAVVDYLELLVEKYNSVIGPERVRPWN